MIPIYNHPSPTPELEDALHGALLHLSRQEGHIDSKNRPILVEGFRYERSVIEMVRHVADNGGAQWHDGGPVARELANELGYVSSANLMAAVREAVNQGLLSASIRDSEGWLMVTDYGMEMLIMWEGMSDE